MPSELVVVAFGGNALWPPGCRGRIAEQLDHARSACAPLIARLRSGAGLLIVFGNGPQVGAELLRSHAARAEVEPAPLDACVAATQGTIGYMLELALRAELVRAGLRVPVSSLASLVLVDVDDPAFASPDKPVGPTTTAAEAAELEREHGWQFRAQAGTNHLRRVVASPRPLELIDVESVRALLAAGHVVLAGGGGGIPVARGRDGILVGVEAVIDKDRTAALLGRVLGAREWIDLTGVDQVQRSFGRPDAVGLARLSVGEAQAMLAAGEFPAGSMGPKIEAAIEFLTGERPGERVLITSLARLGDALDGHAGTWIIPDQSPCSPR